MNKILYLHIYYERNKYICKTMYFKNSLKTTFLYMQGSRDILCCAHVLCPAWKVSLRNTFYKYTSSKYISLHVECEVVWRLISRHWTLCVQRWVTAMLLIYIVSMSFTACLASGRFLPCLLASCISMMICPIHSLTVLGPVLCSLQAQVLCVRSPVEHAGQDG